MKGKLKTKASLCAALLLLCAGQAAAQRCLPGMSSVELRADMADGFYTGASSRNSGYAFEVFWSRFNGHANTWSFGGSYFQSYRPYGERGRIPVSQFAAEGGFNLDIVSDYSQTFHLYGGVYALAGYETVNRGRQLLPDGSMLHDRNAFIYGGAVALQAEFYLSDRFVLTANVKERFVFGNSTGHYHTQYGVGVKFIID